MKSAHRQATTRDNTQNFISIINRMKTWGSASVVNRQIYIEYSQRLKNLKYLQDISALLSTPIMGFKA